MGFPFKWHFIYEDDDASPNENHTKQHPTWQGEAAARDDGGQRRTGVGAECPDGWLASAGGAALRSAISMSSLRRPPIEFLFLFLFCRVMFSLLFIFL